jgi:hypothetical protein
LFGLNTGITLILVFLSIFIGLTNDYASFPRFDSVMVVYRMVMNFGSLFDFAAWDGYFVALDVGSGYAYMGTLSTQLRIHFRFQCKVSFQNSFAHYQATH